LDNNIKHINKTDMAIEIQYNTRFGDSYSAAYARIVNLEINYASSYAEASIGIYRSKEDRVNGKQPVLIETRRYIGEEFEEFFKELSLDSIDASISPVADIYNKLTQEEGKYKDAKKDEDGRGKEDGEKKEDDKLK